MKKNECANRLVCLFFSVAVAVLCVLFEGMEAKSIMHVYDLKPASASLISFQKHPDKCRRTDRTSAGVCKAGGGPAPSPQVRRGNCGAHHVGSSAGEYRIL